VSEAGQQLAEEVREEEGMRAASRVGAAWSLRVGILTGCDSQVWQFSAAATDVVARHCALCAPGEARCQGDLSLAYVPGSEECVTAVVGREPTARAELDCQLGAMLRQQECVEAASECGAARLCDAAFKTEVASCPAVESAARAAMHDCQCAVCASHCDTYRCHDCPVCAVAGS
jgi:hypothetical protein